MMSLLRVCACFMLLGEIFSPECLFIHSVTLYYGPNVFSHRIRDTDTKYKVFKAFGLEVTVHA